MTKFVISETQNTRSYRDGVLVEATDLASAKRMASRMQMFQQSCMKIENEDGDVLSIKWSADEGGKWHDKSAD